MSQTSTQLSRPAPNAGAGVDGPRGGGLDRESRERLEEKAIEGAFASLLASHPEAPVAALEPSGVLVPMPGSVPLERNVALSGRSGLDLVVQEDRVGLLSTWDRVLSYGAARCVIHLVTEPESPFSFCGFDLRAAHGVILAVFIPAGDAVAGGPPATELPKVPPRFATLCKDERSFIVEIDERIEEILGWNSEEVTGHRSIEFIHPDDHALAIDNWMEMLATPGLGRRVRLRHRRTDGTWAWLEVTNHNLLDDPERKCVVSEMVDISDEMATHEALRAREQLWERLAEALPVGLFQLNSEREIVYTNDRFHEIFAVERTSTIEAQLTTLIDADRAILEQALDSVLGGASGADIEVQLEIGRRRETRFCSINLRPLSYDDGTISGAIACVADVTDGTRMREELKKRATFDPLTGCYNRASIMLALERDVTGAPPESDRALMFLDLDRFKEINDRRGHAAGDELLKLVAERLKGAVRADDLVGRIGGDEFLIVCPQIGGCEQALALAGRLAEATQEIGTSMTGELLQRVSIGVAWSKGAATHADALVAQADRAMYEAKRRGDGRPQLATA